MSKLRVLIVDDHPLMREALRAAVDDEPDMTVVGEACNGQEAVDMALSLAPDVIIMDLLLPVKDGLTAIVEIRQRNADARILALTSGAGGDRFLAAVDAGALGYIVKAARREELLRAIRDVGRGDAHLPPDLARRLLDRMRRPPQPAPDSANPLSARERQVLALLGEGATNRDIAKKLTISEGTVRAHVHHILRKLHLSNRSQAVIYALREDQKDQPPPG